MAIAFRMVYLYIEIDIREENVFSWKELAERLEETKRITNCRGRKLPVVMTQSYKVVSSFSAQREARFSESLARGQVGLILCVIT